MVSNNSKNLNREVEKEQVWVGCIRAQVFTLLMFQIKVLPINTYFEVFGP